MLTFGTNGHSEERSDEESPATWPNKLQIGDSDEYFYYPDLEPSKFMLIHEYAIICYKTAGAFSTKTVLNVLSMELYSIEVKSIK